MLSKYFQLKTSTKEFEEQTQALLNEIKDKKVLIYGAGQAFLNLDEKYELTKKLTVTAIADKKFEENNESEFRGIKAVKRDEINKEDFDYALIALENAKPIKNFLVNGMNIEEEKIKILINEDIVDEHLNYNYLENYNFKKHLEKLSRKLKGKSVVIYGAGIFLETIRKYYDLNQLNIIGISDRRFENHKEGEECFNCKVYAPSELKNLKPDYVLVATKFYVNLIEDLYYGILKDTKIKIKPLVRKPFMVLLKEIWG